MEPLIIVDAANVVGSVPNGWWRDRAGATQRLRNQLAGLATNGMPRGPQWVSQGPLAITLVAEGRARGVKSIPEVTILDAPGSGDDAIVEVVTAQASLRPCLVITSDRGLRRRASEAGATVAGTSTLRPTSDHNIDTDMA